MGTRIKKAMIIILLLLSVYGCNKCKTADPIDYYNEIKFRFGEHSLIRKADWAYRTYYVKDEDGKFWIVTLNYEKVIEGPKAYIENKELIFTQE